MPASTPSPASPRRSTGTSSSSPAALAVIADAEALTAVLETFPGRFREALRDAIFARLGLVPRGLDEDMKLVAAIEEALSKQTVDDRPLLLRLARRRRASARARRQPIDAAASL